MRRFKYVLNVLNQSLFYIVCLAAFGLNAFIFYQRIHTTDFDVIIESNEFIHKRYGDFKNIQTIKILKSFDEPYKLIDDLTIDFVGCRLERQTLAAYLFQQKQIDNSNQILEVDEVFLTGECDFFVNDINYQFCRLF